MAVAAAPRLSTNPLRRVGVELASERRAAGRLPGGDIGLSVSRTARMIRDPLRLLLDAYARHGPVFSLRILHARNVFVLGPEANHQVLLATWRDGAVVEVYGWARRLALRVALRALFGIDPDTARAEDPARDFEQALAFYGRDYWLQVLRGPGTPWAAMLAARARTSTPSSSSTRSSTRRCASTRPPGSAPAAPPAT